jgi:hypothetical protein
MDAGARNCSNSHCSNDFRSIDHSATSASEVTFHYIPLPRLEVWQRTFQQVPTAFRRGES